MRTTGIERAVRHEDRHVAIGGRGLGRERGRVDQVRRQRDDAGQPLAVAQAGVQRDRAALRESGEHDARRGDAARLLVRDHRLDGRLRPAHAVQVRALVQVRLADVVPRAHHVAVVDRHRHRRRVREQEADREPRRQAERRHHLRPAVAVVAQSVQPDDGGGRLRAGFDLDGGQHGMSSGGMRTLWRDSSGSIGPRSRPARLTAKTLNHREHREHRGMQATRHGERAQRAVSIRRTPGPDFVHRLRALRRQCSAVS